MEDPSSLPFYRRKQSGRLVEQGDMPAYIQRAGFRFDDVVSFLFNTEPARFNSSKPEGLRLSDDAWAAVKVRVDPLARNILDPHRSYVGAAGMALLISAVFFAIRPGWDRAQIHSKLTDDEAETEAADDDDEVFDDYFEDDEWERKHNHVDDVVLAELDYLNAALDRSFWVWRAGLVLSLLVLFGSVISIAILMERRNAIIDDSIRHAIDEIRPRVQDEGISVDYRTRSSQTGIIFFLGKYIRPTRVVVFRHLDQASPALSSDRKTKKTSSFFSEDYQRKYFSPSLSSQRGSLGDDFTISSSTISSVFSF